MAELLVFKQIGYFCGVMGFVGIISGCSEERGYDFVGRWASVENEGVPAKSSMVVDIVADGRNYHIDVKNTYDGFTRKISNTSKFEGVAESDTVLRVTGAPILLNMRLEGERMFFDGKELRKSK